MRTTIAYLTAATEAGMTKAQACKIICSNQRAVQYWANGTRPTPARATKLMQLYLAMTPAERNRFFSPE